MWTINGYWEWHHVLLSVVRWKWRLCKFRSALHSIALHSHRQTDMDGEISWKGGHSDVPFCEIVCTAKSCLSRKSAPENWRGPDPIKLAIFRADSHFAALMGNDQVTNWQTANFLDPETPDTRNHKKSWEPWAAHLKTTLKPNKAGHLQVNYPLKWEIQSAHIPTGQAAKYLNLHNTH